MGRGGLAVTMFSLDQEMAIKWVNCGGVICCLTARIWREAGEVILLDVPSGQRIALADVHLAILRSDRWAALPWTHRGTRPDAQNRW